MEEGGMEKKKTSMESINNLSQIKQIHVKS